MSSDNQKTTPSSTPSFINGLFWGLVVGFILALYIHRNNPKLFKHLSEKLHQLLKDILSPASPPPSPLSPPSPPRRRPASIRRPKTFTRSRK